MTAFGRLQTLGVINRPNSSDCPLTTPFGHSSPTGERLLFGIPTLAATAECHPSSIQVIGISEQLSSCRPACTSNEDS